MRNNSRRAFIRNITASTTAVALGSNLFAGSNVAHNYQTDNEVKEHFSPIDPIMPFHFFENREEEMLSQMASFNARTGLRRFLLTFPDLGVLLTGLPDPQVYTDFAKLLLRIKNILSPKNIEVGWWCAPALRSGKSSHQSIVGINGIIAENSCCPLDPDFRQVFSKNIASVASIARPFMIQFEDDFEVSNQPPGVRFGCFCPLHLAEFSRREQKNYSRNELEQFFTLQPTTPKIIELRRSWAVLSRDSLVGLAHSIRKEVDVVAPETRLSLCQSGVADFDGDFTKDVTQAFAGNTRPAVRLYGTSYGSDDAQSLPSTIFHALYSQQHLPASFELFHESDTYPHTRFFMSSAKIKSLMTAAFSYGLDDSLFYVSQYLDNPFEEKGYSNMFLTERKRFNALKAAVQDCQVGGCEILYDPFEHIATPFGKRSGIYSWAGITGRLGIPHTSKNGTVKLVSGDTIDIMSDQAIRDLLSTSVFLDGRAAHSLTQKGFGEMIGAEATPGKEALFLYEGLRNEIGYQNISGDLMYNYILAPAGQEGGSFYKLQPISGAEIITEFLDPLEKPVTPGMIRFENKLGGRIAITAFDLSNNRSSSQFNYRKKEIIRQTIEWLGKEKLPVFVRDLPNVFCIFNCSSSKAQGVVTIINLCSDPFSYFSLDIAPEWLNSTFEKLDMDGQWHRIKVEINNNTVKVNTTLSLMDPVILRFNRRIK